MNRNHELFDFLLSEATSNMGFFVLLLGPDALKEVPLTISMRNKTFF